MEELMQRLRPPAVAACLVVILSSMVPTTSLGASPAVSTTLRDITLTARGRELAADSAERFTSYGVPTRASQLDVLQYSDGSVVVVPDLLAPSLSASLSDEEASATVDISIGVASAGSSASEMQFAAAAAAYWTQRETGCLTSLYVDSARLDSCYYIYQLINDGSSTRNYWALRQKGTAFEYAGGLHWAWVSGERTPSTSSQTWVDWGPEQGHDGPCSSINAGVSYVVTLTWTQTACEKWIVDKSCNTCSPWMRATWDCNCLFGLDAKGGTVSRAIGYQMLVSVPQAASPRFRVGLGLGA